MNLVIEFLEKELKEYKADYELEKAYWDGSEDDPNAVKSLYNLREHIAQLEEAIYLLKQFKVNS